MFGYDTWNSVEPYVSRIKSGLSWIFSSRPYTFDCSNDNPAWKKLVDSNNTQALKNAVHYCGEAGHKIVEKLTFKFDCTDTEAWKKLIDTENAADFTKAIDHCGDEGRELADKLINEWSNTTYLQIGAVALAVGFAAYRNRDEIYANGNRLSKLWEKVSSPAQASHKKAA